MNIVFFGATDLGYDCCEALIKAGQKIVGIFTIGKEFNISYSPNKPVTNYLYKDFGLLAKKNGIPLIVVDQKMFEYKQQLTNLRPDFLLAIGWYFLIPESMISLAKFGAAGIHASLLPKYRGNAPLVWSMINGEKKTGVSFFYFSKGVDEGDIISQKDFSIDETDSIREVLLKAKEAAIKTLLEFVPLIADGSAPRIPQNHSDATTFPKRSPEDGLIDWNWDTQRINNFIRAQSRPYPGAYFYIGQRKITLWDAIVDENLS